MQHVEHKTRSFYNFIITLFKHYNNFILKNDNILL